MKKTSKMRLLSVLIFTFCAIGSWGQLVQVPIVRKGESQKKSNPFARTQQTVLTLPFWDDFSFNNPHHIDSVANYPYDSLWQFGHSVWVNSGLGINAPTLNVATFDGIDSVGLPYSISNAYAKGVADRLTSRPLRLDLVDPTRRDSVFIFFYYQYEGNGEAPDAGDSFSLWFKNDSSEWKMVWSIDSASDNSLFIAKKIYLTDAHYFHKNFQFRFQNYGRLSGPFDTWNLDYVYISNGKSQYAPRLSDFPDRAIASPLTSIFKQYRSLPAWHFLYNPDSIMAPPSIVVTNQRKDLQQPVNLDAKISIASRVNNVVTQSATPFYSAPAQAVFYGQPKTFLLDTIHSLAALDPKTDSIGMKLNLWISTKDNKVKLNLNQGDFDTLVYQGIDFRHNDTTQASFLLRNYYAYDDGVAEYAVTLTQPGSRLTYQFDLDYPKPDTVIGVYIYYPHVGDESNQVVKLQVIDWPYSTTIDSVSTKSTRVLWQQDLTIQRTANNKFIYVKFDSAAVVSKRFYIGWIQNTTATIGVGFDKDSDSGSKIFYSTNGTWQQNTILTGNLMIRPVFGSGKIVKQVVTGITEKVLYAYPNPNRGLFYLPGGAQQVNVIDVTGRKISFTEDNTIDQTQVSISGSPAGLYLVHYLWQGRWRSEKIMVVPQ
jgi:hypothetical protein